MNIIERFADSIVVPVVVLENVKNAVPTAFSLSKKVAKSGLF